MIDFNQFKELLEIFTEKITTSLRNDSELNLSFKKIAQVSEIQQESPQKAPKFNAFNEIIKE